MTKHRKTALAKDLRRSIAHSKGRFASILLLVALGTFALVGLYVAGPDMRSAGRAYFGAYDLADLTVVSDYGLTADDEAKIREAGGARAIEFGYFKDVTLAGSSDALRIASRPDDVSTYELVDGRLPVSAGEIAIDSDLAGRYALGGTVEVDEKPNALNDACVLTRTSFTVVGYVNSPEIISVVNMGQSTAGSGSLKGYAVVVPEAFDSDVYMTARLTFDDTEGLDPYSSDYRDRVQAHKDELEGLLANRPAERLAEVKADAREEIDEGAVELEDAKAKLADAESQLEDAASQLASAASQIADAKDALATSLANGRAKLDVAAGQLRAAEPQLAQARSQLTDATNRIASNEAELSSVREQLDEAKAKLDEADAAQARIDTARDAYSKKKAEFDAAAATYDANWTTVSAQWGASQPTWAALDANRDSLNEQQAAQLAQLDQLKASYDQLKAFGDTRDQSQAALGATKAQIDQSQAALDAQTGGTAALAASREEYERNETAYEQGMAQLEQGKRTYAASLNAYSDALETYHAGVTAYNEGVATLQSAAASAQAQIDDAEASYVAGLDEYHAKLDEYNDALPDALDKIEGGQADLDAARERLAKLTVPEYDTSTRREALGSEAYKTYDTVSEIIDSLARVFPVLLYLVAALVTLSTMTRMVEEERINAGTLKALGYSNADIARKFVAYGALAGGMGAVLGIVLGHTLLPMIVYSAYGHAFTLPRIALDFHPGITAVSLVLAMACSVLPAALAVRHELAERPAQLMLPKPPKSGSKIFLERVGIVWRHLSFTHKVTARNLFRYKQRMLMTVLGVAGAACMLVAGFGVQSSINEMGDCQFGQIIKYDMIVAHTPTATDEQLGEVSARLGEDDVASSVPVHYEAVTRAGGANGDKQEVTVIVPASAEGFSDYIQLQERANGTPLELGDDGAIVSERLATLFGLSVGDTFSFTGSDGVQHEVRVAGITEMYMGHFMFLGRGAYERAFGTPFSANADMVRLEDGGMDNVERVSAEVMRLAGVKSVVQNTTMESQVNTIVNSLDKIMKVLIIVATLLGVVIMYNLTNLNVGERMRELSTIKVLGFHTNETTMYIYRETIILTVLGVLVGYVLGVGLHEYILGVVPPDNVMFNPEVAPIEFIVPAVVIGVVTVALYFVELARLRRVDMLEALKSVD